MKSEFALYFACGGDASAGCEDGGCLLDKTVGVTGFDGPSFELSDERCEPADCVGALESVGPDVVVLFSPSSARAADLRTAERAEMLEGLGELCGRRCGDLGDGHKTRRRRYHHGRRDQPECLPVLHHIRVLPHDPFIQFPNVISGDDDDQLDTRRPKLARTLQTKHTDRIGTSRSRGRACAQCIERHVRSARTQSLPDADILVRQNAYQAGVNPAQTQGQHALPPSAYLLQTFPSGLDSARSSHARPRRRAQTIRRRRVPASCARCAEREPADRAGADRGHDSRCSAVVRGVQTDAGEQCGRCQPLGCAGELGKTKGVSVVVWKRTVIRRLVILFERM